MKKIRILKTFGIAASAIVFLSCSDSNGKDQDTTTDKITDSFLGQIKTTKAVLKNTEEELTLTGKVEYNLDKIIKYVPLTNGVVDRIYFSIGDKVAAGQKLFDLRSTELSSLQAEEESLQAEVKIAQRDMQTTQTLFDDNVLSEKELFEAQAKLNQVKATLKRIRTDMSFYQYNTHTGTFSVIAPMSGYIVDRTISSGSTLSGDGVPAFTIADLSSVWIIANVYAKELPLVHENMDAEIALLSYPGKTFDGKINTLSNVFDKDERILKARILMDNKDLLFKPEMSAVITLKKQSDNKMVAVPSDALIFDNNQYYIVVEKTKGEYDVRRVQLHHRGNGTSYIESGLSEGEEVVIKNQLLVYSQLK